MIKEEANYLTEYCNLSLEWHKNGIDIDNASENQINHMKELQKKAIEQSGLTHNELTLILRCRKYGVFKKVNTYMIKLTSKLTSF